MTTPHWTDVVSMVLLGTRAALKDDLGCSTAELVYGATLCLPGEFFSASDDTLPDASNYANQLRTAMQGLQVTPTCTPLARLVCIPRSFLRAPTYLCGTTLSGDPCSNHMMDLTRFYNALRRPSYLILTVVERRSP